MKNNTYLIAGSIVAAGVVIALAIFAAGNSAPGTPINPDGTPIVASANIPEVTTADYIKGSRNAPVTLIEYADVQCSHCQRLHGNLTRLYNEGSVSEEDFAWVYRHFPIFAPEEAHSMECVGKIGGNEAFWNYLDALYAETQITPPNSDEALADLAVESAGVDRSAFLECQKGRELVDLVTQDGQDAQSAGAQGTPFNVFVLNDPLSDEDLANLEALLGPGIPVNEDKTRIVVAGGLPYEVLSTFVTALIESTK